MYHFKPLEEPEFEELHPPEEPDLVYNPLHDLNLKSVWWVLAFFVLAKDSKVEYASATQQVAEYVKTSESARARLDNP